MLDLKQEIDPYNVTLNKMRVAERKQWSNHVLKQLEEEFDLNRDHFIFLAGNRYREFLLDKIESYEIPLKGLGIGKQLQFLKKALKHD